MATYVHSTHGRWVWEYTTPMWTHGRWVPGWLVETRGRPSCLVECYWCAWVTPMIVDAADELVRRWGYDDRDVLAAQRARYLAPPIPLCERCHEWHLGIKRFEDHPDVVAARRAGRPWFGGPYEPTAITRAARLICRWMTSSRMPSGCTPSIDMHAARIIAEFLVDFKEP